jgi:predicted TIM-barrel fold metal-dependent hydrolase
MGHSGATDYWTDAIPVYKLCPNIWMESSLRLQGVVASFKEVGYERGIFGSGYPYNDLSFEISKMKQLLPEPYHQAVFGANLLKLLGNE